MCHCPMWEQAEWHIVIALYLYSAQRRYYDVDLETSVVGPEEAMTTTIDVFASLAQRRTSVSSKRRFLTSAVSVW